MTLLQLSYFLEVCTCRNMTKAASNLHVSQPAITKAIQELEREYGVKLLIRNKNVQDLTYEGKLLYTYAEQLLQQARDLDNAMHQVGGTHKCIRVGISILFAQLYPDILNAFRSAHPDIEVKSYAFGGKELQRYVKSGSLDIGISGSPADSRFQSRTLLETASYFWTNRSNPLSKKNVINIEQDLNNDPIGLFRESMENFNDPNLIDHYPLSNSSTANIITCTNQLGDIRRRLLDNTISTFLPKHALDNCPDLISIPTTPPVRFSFSAYWKNEYMYGYIMDFVNFIEDYVSQCDN